MRLEQLGRRDLAAAAAGALWLPTSARANPFTKSDFKWENSPFAGLSTEEIEALGESSTADGAGVLLPSGVRVIDLVKGSGPLPERGQRVWVHYKVWAGGFRAGPAVDYSFPDSRPRPVASYSS